MTEQLVPIIFDNGSAYSKVGFAGDDNPNVVFPSVTGRQRAPPSFVSTMELEILVGDNAFGRKGVYTYTYPIDRGLITDWNHLEKIWNHTFYNELSLYPDGQELLLMETPLNPKSDRETMAKIMFEELLVSSLYLANRGVMSLIACGKTTGLALESGDGLTSSVPVYEGIVLQGASSKIELGGKDLTDSLKKIIVERGYIFNTTFEIELINDMKEQLCYVAMNFEEEYKKDSLETDYELPDGNMVTIGSERFRTGEILFNPSLIGMEFGGIHELISTSIRKCDIDIRKEMYSNIVLSGGSTLLNGIAERLSNELQETSPSIKNRITSLPDRKHQAWIGGSIFASLSAFKQLSIKKEEYDETGLNIVHRK